MVPSWATPRDLRPAPRIPRTMRLLPECWQGAWNRTTLPATLRGCNAWIGGSGNLCWASGSWCTLRSGYSDEERPCPSNGRDRKNLDAYPLHKRPALVEMADATYLEVYTLRARIKLAVG